MNNKVIEILLRNLAAFAQTTLSEIAGQSEREEQDATVAPAQAKPRARFEGILGDYPSDPMGWRSYWSLSQNDSLSGKYLLLEKWYHQSLDRVRSKTDRERIQSVLERVNLDNSTDFFSFYELLVEAPKTPESNFFTFILRTYANTGDVIGAGRDEVFGFQNNDWREFARRMDFVLDMGQFPHWYPTLVVPSKTEKVFTLENRNQWVKVFTEVVDFLTPLKSTPAVYELSELSLAMSRLKFDIPEGKEEEFLLESIRKIWTPERLNEKFVEIDCEEAWLKIRSLVARHFRVNKDRLLEVYRMSAPRPPRQLELFNLEMLIDLNELAEEVSNEEKEQQSASEEPTISKIDLGDEGVDHPAFSLAVERTIGSFALVYAVHVGRTLEPKEQPAV